MSVQRTHAGHQTRYVGAVDAAPPPPAAWTGTNPVS
jgi:hypothetical protein